MGVWLLVTTVCVLGIFVPGTLQQDEGTPGLISAPELTNMFNCFRPGIECFNNATCDAPGPCTCTEPYTGLGCDYNITAVRDACEECNGEQCMDEEDGSVTCICSESLFGDKCEYPRVSLKCHPDSMDISIAPVVNGDSKFSGYIHVKDQGIDESCFATEDTEMEGNYKITLDNDACGGADNVTNDDGSTDVFFNMTVQYDYRIQTDTDQVFTFRCNVLPSGGDQDLATLDFESDKSSPLQEQTITENLKPVSVEVLDESDAPVTNAVPVGSIVKFRFTLTGGSVYESFNLMSASMNNGLEGDLLESLTFVEDGCASEEAGKRGVKVLVDFSGDPTSSINLKFKAFKFLRSNDLKTKFSVRLCKKQSECPVEACDEFEYLGRRRRREAHYQDTESTTYKQYNTTLHVYRPIRPSVYETSYNTPATTITSPNMWTCLNQPGFLILIIVLIVFLIVALALVALCCVRAMHTKTESQGYHNKGYSS